MYVTKVHSDVCPLTVAATLISYLVKFLELTPKFTLSCQQIFFTQSNCLTTPAKHDSHITVHAGKQACTQTPLNSQGNHSYQVTTQKHTNSRAG